MLQFRRRVEALSIRVKLLFPMFAIAVAAALIAAISVMQIGAQKRVIGYLYLQTTTSDWISQAMGVRSDIIAAMWTGAANYEQGKPASSAASVDDMVSSTKQFSDFIERFKDEIARAADRGRDRETTAVAKMSKDWEAIVVSLKSVQETLTLASVEPAKLRAQVSDCANSMLVLSDTLSEVLAMQREYGTLQLSSAEKAFVLFKVIGIFVCSLIRDSSRNVANYAKKLADTSGVLSGGVTQQAALVEEMTSKLSTLQLRQRGRESMGKDSLW